MRLKIDSLVIMIFLLFTTGQITAQSTAPTITCPQNITQCSGTAIPVSWNQPTINNPSEFTIVSLDQISGPSPGSLFNPGTTTEIGYRLTYRCGFIILSDCYTYCYFTVTITLPPTRYYQDLDNDGFGNPNSSQLACSQPEHYVLNQDDCNDNNPNINPNTKWYKDMDGDGYSDGYTLTQCLRPLNFKLLSELLGINDCDDADATAHQEFSFYRDFDNDGHGAENAKPTFVCAKDANSPPQGYSIDNTDCDDDNNEIWRTGMLYIDRDNDGFDFGQELVCYGATIPQGYSATTKGDDCDDSDPNLRGFYPFYPDRDHDGYGDANSKAAEQICVYDENSPPDGYSANNLDCDDSNPAININTQWIKDADGDGYYSGVVITSCTSPGVGYIIKTTQLAGDCNDNDATVNPGAVEVCGNGIDDNCNGVVDEKTCFQCQNATSLTTTEIAMTSAKLNWIAIAHPQQWDIRYKSTNKGSQWIDSFVTGNKRSLVVDGLSPNQNYQWQIRAKCGKNWTAYSDASQFITANGAMTKLNSMSANVTLDEKLPISSLEAIVSPNPSSNGFRIAISSNDEKEPVQMLVVDMVGRIIEKRVTSAGKIMTIGNNFRSGTYAVKIIQGQNVRQLKLIKLPN